MKKVILTIAMLGLLSCGLLAAESLVGKTISDFTVTDMNGKQISYSAFKGTTTVVIFFSTRCPISNSFNYRRNKLYNDFGDRVKFIVLDANRNESLEQERNYAHEIGFDFPVFQDKNNVVADLFGAQVTTDTYVLDSSGAIRYHGYLEDSPNPTRSKIQGLRLAIESVLNGRPVAIPETTARGCSIIRINVPEL